VPVLVLGLTYRENVKELAYSRAIPLIERLRFHGAEVWAYDPLMSAEEVERLGVRAWHWGEASPAQAIVVQTGAAEFRALDHAAFPELRVVYDGRNALRDVARPERVRYVGVGRGDGTRAGRRLATAGRGAGR
jgi:UDP-N-acetyl-D-mannosaminuronate dehydrogenase